jgi:hypothetical protein
MLAIEELKKNIKVTTEKVECPVIGCKNIVERMRKRVLKPLDAYLERREGRRQDFERYLCKEHKIYITPTTFIYDDFRDNLLWYDVDKDLFSKIIEVKRVKAQVHHDNSEDAVTWNVFRFLERSKLLSEFLSKLCNAPVANPEVIYWSYSQSQQSVWDELEKARAEFGEIPQRGSEPDLIVKSDDALFFIEAKLTATNETTPSNPKELKRYLTGGNNWYDVVFRSGYQTIAIKEKKYELLRFWLLGTWIATQQDLDFYLVNLVLSERERDIEAIFKKHIHENQRRNFVRIAWEDIYQHVSSSVLSGRDKNMIIRYFKNKTIGYDGKGKLQRAFSIP